VSWSRWLSAGFCLILWAPVPVSAAPSAGPLFHGNWCGAGDANRAAPIDAFDAACRAHDLCYERVGRGACLCDRAFLEATATLVKSRRTPETVRSKAATANSLFSAALCTETRKMPRRVGNR
jgi:hypothetical protein